MNPNSPRESVCRSLFGPVDRQQLRRDLKQKLKEMSEQDTRRWNFNFQTDTPLPGSFQWEEIPSDHAAAFYQPEGCSPDREDDIWRIHIHGESNQENFSSISRNQENYSSSSNNQENQSRISNTSKCPAEVTPVRRKRTLPKLTVNSQITDFFVKRKRTSETKRTQNPFLHSSGETPLCKTIR